MVNIFIVLLLFEVYKHVRYSLQRLLKLFNNIFFVSHFMNSLCHLVHFAFSSSVETTLQFGRAFQIRGVRVPFPFCICEFVFISVFKKMVTQFQLHNHFVIAFSLLFQHLVQLERVLFLNV